LEIGLKMLKPSVNETCVASAGDNQIGLWNRQELALKRHGHSVIGTDYEGVHGDTNLLGLEGEDESGHWRNSRGITFEFTGDARLYRAASGGMMGWASPPQSIRSNLLH
jgi:hypothetical protein